MIVLGTFWSPLYFSQTLQLFIFRISRAHTTKKTCPQIKKKGISLSGVTFAHLHPTLLHSWVPVLANGTLEEAVHGGNV